jgi:hypothetical protein
MRMKKHRRKRLSKYRTAVANGKAAKSKARGLRLLPYPIRENLPLLGSERRKGGPAKVLAKCFLADGSRTWYVSEGSARRDTDGQAVDYLLYGLVEEGGCRKLDYFWLSDLATLRSPAGAPVERDAHWRPKGLAEIAPEMFPINVGKGD